MAVAKQAHVVNARTIGPDTRLLELEAAEPLGFVGGQYIIIDSGLVSANGKAVKRAYSLMTSDAEQTRFQLAVQRIPSGPGSDFLHGLEAGKQISFSGPWGKFYVREEPVQGTTLVLSTDTGVTAALGLVRSARFAALLPQTDFVWLRTGPDYFLPEAMVREAIPKSCRDVQCGIIPDIDHPERVSHVRAVFRYVLSCSGIANAFVSGDGAIASVLLDDLTHAGVPTTKDHIESFFNMPKKSA
jgi:ferredoxin-NADP reductase